MFIFASACVWNSSAHWWHHLFWNLCLNLCDITFPVLSNTRLVSVVRPWPSVCVCVCEAVFLAPGEPEGAESDCIWWHYSMRNSHTSWCILQYTTQICLSSLCLLKIESCAKTDAISVVQIVKILAIKTFSKRKKESKSFNAIIILFTSILEAYFHALRKKRVPALSSASSHYVRASEHICRNGREKRCHTLLSSFTTNKPSALQAWLGLGPPRLDWNTTPEASLKDLSSRGSDPPRLSLSLSLGGDWKWVAFIAHTEYCCLNGVAVRLATNAFTDSCRPSNVCQMKFASLFFKRTWNYNEPFLKKYLWFDFAQFSAFYSWKCSSFYTSNPFFLA